MGRKVFVSSDIAVDERLIDVAAEDGKAALLWPWLLTAMDDWGRAEASPKRLKARVFPSNPIVTADDIQSALLLFEQVGLVVLYMVDGKPYMAVREETWWRYQTHIHKSKRRKDESKIPAPPRRDDIAESRVIPRDSALSRDDPRDVAEPREGARDRYASPLPPFHPSTPDGKDTLGARAPKSARRRRVQVKLMPPDPAFEAVWAEYPRRVNKGDARAAWEARAKRDPDAALAAVRNYARYCRDRPVEPRYVMHMARFFGPKEPYLEWVDGIPEDARRELEAKLNGHQTGRRTGGFGAGTGPGGTSIYDRLVIGDPDNPHDPDLPEVRSGAARGTPG